MKLYYARAAAVGGRWTGTQVDAKRLDKDFVQRDVPVDKPSLIAFLNNYEAHLSQVCEPQVQAQALDPLQLAELRAVQADQVTTMPPPPPAQHTSDSIIDFVLNGATVAQVEGIFAALGTRFKELSNGAG